jgi:polyisoprenoid-binding protein YceI
MKKLFTVAGSLALFLGIGLCAQAADPVMLTSKPGSKMRIEGTSTIHDWQAECPFISGYVEAGANFPLEPGQAATAGKIDAKVEMFITARSLKSKEKDGKLYSDKMDEIMWEKLKAQQSPKIQFRLSELTLKEPAASKDAPYNCEAKGELTVAGVTNKLTMPVQITPLGDKKVKISGTTTVKMTDFKIEPPNPIGFGIKTGDDVKLIFTWMLAQKPDAAASAK